MSVSVSGELPLPVEELLEKLYELAGKHDVEFQGDNHKGYAKGKGFHVHYVIDGNQCTLTVTKKPLLVPWSLVERSLKKLF